MTLTEAHTDLAETNRDLSNVAKIIEGLESFMESDQPRVFLKVDLMRYKALQREGLQCKATIESWIKKQEHLED